VGLGTLCGVGLSAGGFGIAAAVYLLGFERYRPVLRAAVLVSFLGYMSVIVGMMYELGLPWRIWHPIVMWNRHSMLFEVSWCVMLYSTVLSLEFSPALVEKIPWVGLRTWYLKQQHRILIGLVLVGCVLPSLHQSFLGGLYLLTKGKLDPLWHTPYLTTLFYFSAIPAGIAVTVMALYLCVRSLNVKLDTRILSELSRVIAPMLALYGIFRGVDLLTHGALPYMFKWREETLSFWLEIGLFVVAPLVLLSLESVSQIFITGFTRATIGGISYDLNTLAFASLFDAFGGLNASTTGFVGEGDTFTQFRITAPTNGGWNLNFAYVPANGDTPAYYYFTDGEFSANARLVTPEPGTVSLMLVGLAGIAGIAKRKVSYCRNPRA
jgi:Ni/Fe-hydrogenase subunit HybB-like protein